MNVSVKHNGTNISGYIISYEREHKICTGIGTLTVQVDRTIPRTFDTWDSIDIWENGSFKVRYYISSVTDIEPKGILVLDCQDISKKLVDYFIPDSYTVDYPSYNRYWIERFLTEAGVSYRFTTTSQGTLLSNFTQLGLVTVYEQLQTLLQMSGWYMYFDGDEKAVIGALDLDLAAASSSIGKTDILSITKLSNDKMLRNRALVLGSYDAYRGAYASADVSVKTPWNYDSRDLRTVVISNSNIKDKETAYGMANQIIKEFARITVEKHITVWGARNFNLGTALRVKSDVWRGRGLITTFGTSMSKDGLVTNIILDERCPRLFGFFDFGDYVYVATYGDGIWRKHIKYDNTFYNFSEGLTNLNITDMHINNGVFGAVGASGEMFYATDGLPWGSIPLSGLVSSRDATITDSGYSPQLFSGLMARAVIVDKIGNVLRFAVDNASGINYGDYFLTYSGGYAFPSGMMASGIDHRAWIVEYDILNGDLAGTPYPISLSGNYNFTAIDLENDGKNDYVSVVMASGGYTVPNVGGAGNYGYGYRNYYDSSSYISWGQLNGLSPSSLSYTDTALKSFGAVDDSTRHEIFYCKEAIGGTTFVIVKFSESPTNHFTQTEYTTKYIVDAYAFGTSNYSSSIISPSPGIYKFAAQLSDGTWGIVTITNTGGATYSIATTSLVASNITLVNQSGSLCSLIRTTGTGDGGAYDKLIEAGYMDILTGNVSFGTVWSSGGTITDRKEPYCRVFALNGNIYVVGVQVEWNTGDPTNKTMKVLTGGLGGLSLGSTIETGNISIPPPMDNGRVLSYSRAMVTGTLLSTDTWCVYNNGTYNTLTAAPTNTRAVMNSSDGITAYKLTTGATPKLQQTTIPIGTWSDVSLGSEIPDASPFMRLDSINGGIWIRTHNSIITSNKSVYNITTGQKFTFDTVAGVTDPAQIYSFNVGRFLLMHDSDLSVTFHAYVMQDVPQEFGPGTGYLVLQRDGTDFHLIEQEGYPIRVDISNNAPVLTVGSGESSFVSNYVYGNELTVVEPVSISGRKVDDYRYTFLEPAYGGSSPSGLGIQSMILYVTGSGVYGVNALTYSGGFQVMYNVPSGYGTRIETSNYGMDGQYVFITASGNVQLFFQKDPSNVAFTYYSGLPASRATIIRLDDRV